MMSLNGASFLGIENTKQKTLKHFSLSAAWAIKNIEIISV